MEIKSYDFQYPSQPYLEKVCWSCWDGLWPPGIGNMLGCIYTTATIETSVVADCQALFAGTTHVREVISGASDDGCCPTIANEDYTEFFLNCSGTHLGLGAWNQPPCICMGPIVAGHWADGSPPSGGINADFGISIGGCSEDKQNYLSYKEAAGVCSPIPAVGDTDHSGIPGFNYGDQTIRPACAVEPCTGCPGMIELGHTPVVEGAWDGNTGTSTYTSPIEGGLTTSVVTHDCGVGSLVGAGEFCYQCFKPSDANDGSGKGPCDFDLTGAWNGWAVCMDLFLSLIHI